MTGDKVSLKKLKFYLLSIVDNMEKVKKRNEVEITKIEKNLLEAEKFMASLDKTIINGGKNDN